MLGGAVNPGGRGVGLGLVEGGVVRVPEHGAVGYCEGANSRGLAGRTGTLVGRGGRVVRGLPLVVVVRPDLQIRRAEFPRWGGQRGGVGGASLKGVVPRPTISYRAAIVFAVAVVHIDGAVPDLADVFPGHLRGLCPEAAGRLGPTHGQHVAPPLLGILHIYLLFFGHRSVA